MIFKQVNKFFHYFKKTALLFTDSNGLTLSASLSYYTVFSIAPFLIVIISFAGVFYGKQAVEGKVYMQISGLVGKGAAMQIQQIIQNIQNTHHGLLGGIIGFIVLIVGASSVFSEIQSSINVLWKVNATPPGKGLINFVRNKLLSFSLIAGVAFILLVSLIINAVVDVLSETLKQHFPPYVVETFYVLNILVIFLVITILFAIIFKVLPAAIISWKDALIGASFTAFLFLIGKLFIGIYLGNSSVGATYGATAAILIFMLWVYYSSIILYFGASFTKILTDSKGTILMKKRKFKSVRSTSTT
ncbi:MAG TPA: YihY/virulence factor BrkB family protein [Puia sp.]|nr:YihY/virulence factor BrkB family protein [Puia sp.]